MVYGVEKRCSIGYLYWTVTTFALLYSRWTGIYRIGMVLFGLEKSPYISLATVHGRRGRIRYAKQHKKENTDQTSTLREKAATPRKREKQLISFGLLLKYKEEEVNG